MPFSELCYSCLPTFQHHSRLDRFLVPSRIEILSRNQVLEPLRVKNQTEQDNYDEGTKSSIFYL